VVAGTVPVDPDTIAVVRDWPLPRNLTELRSLLGLANYFRRFVKDYSRVAAPLTDFTSEKAIFDYCKWPAKHLAIFNALKQALISTPVLCLLAFSQPYY
jgi:hypothetical protein